MKKFVVIALTILTTIGLVAWGFKGHRAIATIAENHLNANVKDAVKMYLNGQSMAEVSTWADELRNDPKYKETAPWHYLNLPLGLTYDKFVKAITTQDKENVYSALEKNIATLRSPSKDVSANDKADALKFIIHLVGDAHQPMHISRAEDKGGNSIQLRFEDKGTNLHSLWDSGLINKEGLSEAEIVKNYDTATPTQIKQWQSNEPMEWLWESYVISSKLYAEADKSKNIDDVYYNKYLPTVRQRVNQAGIRLAGLLNDILKDVKLRSSDAPVTSVNASEPKVVPALIANVKDVSKLMGQAVTITDKVYGTKDVGSMILVNVGAAYPNSPLTVVLRGEAKSLASSIDGKVIKVTGVLIDYKGKPEIIVTDPSMIVVVDIVKRPGVRGG